GGVSGCDDDYDDVEMVVRGVERVPVVKWCCLGGGGWHSGVDSRDNVVTVKMVMMVTVCGGAGCSGVIVGVGGA
nr:hypothetical protein [Tanacetum cinerariifolium]